MWNPIYYCGCVIQSLRAYRSESWNSFSGLTWKKNREKKVGHHKVRVGTKLHIHSKKYFFCAHLVRKDDSLHTTKFFDYEWGSHRNCAIFCESENVQVSDYLIISLICEFKMFFGLRSIGRLLLFWVMEGCTLIWITWRWSLTTFFLITWSVWTCRHCYQMKSHILSLWRGRCQPILGTSSGKLP